MEELKQISFKLTQKSASIHANQKRGWLKG